MGGVNVLLTERLKKKEGPSKAAALAKQSANGRLTGFTGIFGSAELTEREKEALNRILLEFSSGHENVRDDLNSLITITSEVKAINNQAALLHGERIKNAQKILVKYKDGAFTSWLIATYGNRQTPYNFLQYFEFYESIPQPLRPQIEAMPRQAIYTLASREGSMAKKREIVESYEGQTKEELLRIIRETFPLGEQDRRKQNYGEAAIQHLRRACIVLSEKRARLSRSQKEQVKELIETIKKIVS